jgi:LacI family transcriptional regulator
MVERASVTLADVAKLAGVSLATASRALNGSDRRVNPDLVARVAAAAAELRYSTNVQAQAVARGTTNTLALVVGDIADPYFASVAAGAIREADAAGLVVTMTATGGDAARERAALSMVTGLRPRAVVIAVTRRVGNEGAPEDTADGDLEELVERGSGVVVLGSDERRAGPGVPGVRTLVVRNRAGAEDLAHALVDAGYRDFAVLAGNPGLVTPRARVRGFLDGLAARGLHLPEERIVTGPFSRDGGHDAMAAILDAGARPSCVFAVTDVMAVGALAAIREQGLEPGADVAVAGFDDVRMLADIVPGLTTVRLPLEDIGVRAVRLALGAAESAAVSGTVVLRASTPVRS